MGKIFSQYICMSNHHDVHFKYITIMYLSITPQSWKKTKNFKKSVNNRNQSNNMIIKTGRKKRQVANKLINQNCSKSETFNLCKTDLMMRKNGEFCF